MDYDDDAYLPSQATIRRECERIRESWSPAERARRWCGPSDAARFQAFHVDRHGRHVVAEVADLPR
jgi:hypothetical protein